MARLTEGQDAFGQGIYSSYRGGSAYEIVERDDGYVAVSGGPAIYLAEYRDWPKHQKQGIRFARGRVLDVGCGGGRVALHLQRKGLPAVGIDVSPLAIRVCKARGVKDAIVLSVTGVSRKLGTFDTIVMYGNNFGLFANRTRARRLLRRFHALTSVQARIIAESRDPYGTRDPLHLAYHARNRRRGRMSGQLRIRVRFRTYRTPWFEYLLVSKDEMRELLCGTGWTLRTTFDGEGGSYVAVIEKERAQPARGG